MMHLQKNITFSYYAAIPFFTATQGTWVHKYDRGPSNLVPKLISIAIDWIVPPLDTPYDKTIAPYPMKAEFESAIGVAVSY